MFKLRPGQWVGRGQYLLLIFFFIILPLLIFSPFFISKLPHGPNCLNLFQTYTKHHKSVAEVTIECTTTMGSKPLHRPQEGKEEFWFWGNLWIGSGAIFAPSPNSTHRVAAAC